MTQKEFSEQTEISQSTISDWKRKGTNIFSKIGYKTKKSSIRIFGSNERNG